MIDLEKIVSKYNTKFEDNIDVAQKVMGLYSELCEAISAELAKTLCRGFLIPAVSAAFEVSAKGIMRPFGDDEFICALKSTLIAGTKTISMVNRRKEQDNE